ncbi:MAG: hypothetical protein ACYC2R_09735 [Burkholderiales bacterium]
MSDWDVAHERLLAVRVRDALHRIISKLSQGKPTAPSELSVWVRKSGDKVSGLFLWMVCTAIAEKYRQADKHDTAAKILALRMACELFWRQQNPNWDDRQRLFDVARPVQGLTRGIKRISQHQSRWICPDLDILLCADAAFSIDRGITPWVCQQPDLRFRWTPESMIRLAYLADCWDAYSRSDFTWADRLIGLPDFPTHPEYC